MKEKRQLRESRKGNSLKFDLKKPNTRPFFASFAPLRENCFWFDLKI
jgi:hypothetical protein